MLKWIFVAVFAAVPLAALAQSPRPAASPSPAPPCPVVSASPRATILPSPSPAPLPTPLVLPPEAPPQILAIAINCPVFHSGDLFAATVITSTNVPAVELRVVGKIVRFQRVDFGIWHLSYTLPRIPRRFLRDYPAQIVAMNTVNVYVSRDITLSLR